MTLPVDDHLRLLSVQFYAATLQDSHPSHSVVRLDSGPRDKKPVLQSVFKNDLDPFLLDNVLPPGVLKDTIKALHTNAVAAAVVKLDLKPNRVLGVKPPIISKDETRLPRSARSTLSQLRSGFCKHLRHYQNFIDNTTDPACPECGTGTHDSSHLFSCPSFPTDLIVEDLWKQPCEVSTFLSQTQTFRELFPANPPPRRPPPEPPP